MSDKLISLESVLKEIRRFKGYIDDDMIERFTIAFKRLPTVPHEMTARELLYAERSMYNEDSDAYWKYSDLVIKEEIEHAVCYIKKWAQEHPEERNEE